MRERLAVWFMGFSGSGKDTQAGLVKDVLEKKYGLDSVLWLSTGDALRDIVKSGSFAGHLIEKKVLGAGNIAPPFIATLLWAGKAVRELQINQHVIFPSSPRTLNEARDLDDFVGFFDRKAYPIFLNIEREEAFRRLKARGRADDTDEIINNRLDYFARHVLPAVEYFRKESKNRLIEIDGNPRDPQKIHKDILVALGFD